MKKLRAILFVAAVMSGLTFLIGEPAVAAGGCPPDVETCHDDMDYWWEEGGTCVSGGCDSAWQFCCM